MLTYGFTRYETIAMQNDLVQPYDDLPELLSKAAKPSSVSDPARLMTNDIFAEQLGVSTDWLHSPRHWLGCQAALNQSITTRSPPRMRDFSLANTTRNWVMAEHYCLES